MRHPKETGGSSQKPSAIDIQGLVTKILSMLGVADTLAEACVRRALDISTSMYVTLESCWLGATHLMLECWDTCLHGYLRRVHIHAGYVAWCSAYHYLWIVVLQASSCQRRRKGHYICWTLLPGCQTSRHTPPGSDTAGTVKGIRRRWQWRSFYPTGYPVHRPKRLDRMGSSVRLPSSHPPRGREESPLGTLIPRVAICVIGRVGKHSAFWGHLWCGHLRGHALSTYLPLGEVQWHCSLAVEFEEVKMVKTMVRGVRKKKTHL